MKNFISLSMLILLLSITSLYSDKAPDRKPKFLSSPDGVDSEEITGYNGTNNPEAQKYYNSAVDAFRRNKPEEAIDFYKKAIEEDPRFVEAYDNLGRVYRGMNMPDSAIYYYDKSLKLYPKGVFANQNKAIVYFYNEDYDKAIELYKHMIDIIPESPEGYYGLAQVYLETLELDDALEEIDKAIERYQDEDSPLLGDGYITKALIYAKMEDIQNVKKNLILAKESGAVLNENMERLISSDENKKPELSEKETVIKAINWYLETPPNESNKEKIKEVGAYALKWIIDSPDVTVLVDTRFVPEGCGECLLAFMFAWTKYSLENNAKDKPEDACYAAVKATTGYYLKNKDLLGENQKYEDLIELEMEGKLRETISSILSEIDK